jgi:hypothetical protein
MALKLASNERGQAVIEYILLLSVVVFSYVSIVNWMNRFGLMQKMTGAVTQGFASTYRYGDAKAKGFDDGDPKRHPLIHGCEGCFRIFISPR